MMRRIRTKLADVILPNDHVIIKNYYRSAPMYIDFEKGLDYVYSQDMPQKAKTSGEQLQTFE